MKGNSSNTSKGGNDKQKRKRVSGKPGSDRPINSTRGLIREQKSFDKPQRSSESSDGDRPKRSFSKGKPEYNRGDSPRNSSNYGDKDKPKSSYSEGKPEYKRGESSGSNEEKKPFKKSFGSKLSSDSSRSNARFNDGDRPKRSFSKGRPSFKRDDSSDNDGVRKSFSYGKKKPFSRDGFKGKSDFRKPSNDSSERPSSPSRKGKEKDLFDQPMRLNKFVANAGVCSRREADKLIADGLITVNAIVVTEMGTKVLPTDSVKYAGEKLSSERSVFILMNKPKNHITTVSDEKGRKTVMDILGNKVRERVYPVGRLDRDTTGVLLLTNDGQLAKKLTHPSFNIKKIYIAELDKSVDQTGLRKLQEGIELDDGIAKFDLIEYVDPSDSKKRVRVELHSGKNRIVRRMFESLGIEVLKLDRTSFAGLTKGMVTRGKWRFLEAKEVGFLKKIG